MKKGQIYIFTALILIAIAFGVTTGRVMVKPLSPTFSQLHESFMGEATIAINNAVYQNKNVSKQLEDFATLYSQYAKTKDPKFRYLYVLAYQDKMTIHNRLGKEVFYNFQTLTDNQVYYFDRKDTITLTIDKINYPFKLNPSENVQLKAIFISEKEGDKRIKVYT